MINTELDIFAEAKIDEPMPCEHSQHDSNTYPGHHGGNAEWYVIYDVCSECGDNPLKGQMRAYCDKWVSGIESGSILPLCTGTGEWHTPPAKFKLKERIKDVRK